MGELTQPQALCLFLSQVQGLAMNQASFQAAYSSYRLSVSFLRQERDSDKQESESCTYRVTSTDRLYGDALKTYLDLYETFLLLKIGRRAIL